MKANLAVLPGILALAALVASCRQAAPPPAPAALPVIATPSGVRMVAIPAGSFDMGSAAGGARDEQPHRVRVSAFYLDQYEVTQEHFQKVLGRNPSRWKDPRNPVEQVRWKEAAEYSNARSRLEGLEPAYDPKTWQCDFAASGYRLPTEAEWEYACRAGTQTEYTFGNGPAALGEYAWCKESGVQSPQPVGGRKPNPWGLHDMYGNVWEWCNDVYTEDTYASSPGRDPHGPEAGETRVLRGGCWNSRAALCRSAYRNDENPGYTDACFGRDVHGVVGFRCARRQPAPAK